MSKFDVTFKEGTVFSIPATETYQTQLGGTAINYGEPCKIDVSAPQYVIPLADAEPVVGTTDPVVGIAATDSTHTASVDGVVQVFKPLTGAIYLCAAKSPTAVDTQTKYDALVNLPVLFDLDINGVFTIDTGSTTGADGLVICPLDISKYPGKVAFSIKNDATIYA